MSLSKRLVLPVLAAAVAAFLAIFVLTTLIRWHAASSFSHANDAALVAQSSDQFDVDFARSFRSSSIKSCKDVASSRIPPTSPFFPQIDGLCACAADRMLSKLTAGDARAAISGDRENLKARFKAETAACIADFRARGALPPAHQTTE